VAALLRVGEDLLVEDQVGQMIGLALDVSGPLAVIGVLGGETLTLGR
jgi:hypothetical protein